MRMDTSAHATLLASWLAVWHVGAACGLSTAERSAAAQIVAAQMVLLQPTAQAGTRRCRSSRRSGLALEQPRVRKLWKRPEAAPRRRAAPLGSDE